MIEVKNLYKSFGNKEVLHDINTKFEDGKTNLIIGQSGAGKTVLVQCLVGLLEPTCGEVLYDGRNFVMMSKKEKILMRREMGMIFQGSALFDSLTVFENVRFPLDMFSDMTPKERDRQAQKCIDRVNLTGAENKYPGEISGGMQKRVAIARAVVMNSVMGIGENIVFIADGRAEWQGNKETVLSANNKKLNDLVFASDLFKKVKEVENEEVK